MVFSMNLSDPKSMFFATGLHWKNWRAKWTRQSKGWAGTRGRSLAVSMEPMFRVSGVTKVYGLWTKQHSGRVPRLGGRATPTTASFPRVHCMDSHQALCLAEEAACPRLGLTAASLGPPSSPLPPAVRCQCSWRRPFRWSHVSGQLDHTHLEVGIPAFYFLASLPSP